MKKIYPKIACFLILFGFNLNSQIPNAGFETWANGKPTGWSASNFGNATPITQVNNAHGGTSAMKMQFDPINMAGPVARCPESPYHFYYSGRPLSLSGWFITNFSSADHINIACTLSKSGTDIGSTSTDVATVTSVYKKFYAPITYSSSGNADSARIELIVWGSSMVLVDDLQFESTIDGITDHLGQTGEVLKVFNDPISKQMKIEYHNLSAGQVQLTLFDINGKMVESLLSQTQDAGEYRLYKDLDAIHAGIYFVRFQSVRGTFTQKCCVLK
jgi:hypothetical protein